MNTRIEGERTGGISASPTSPLNISKALRLRAEPGIMDTFRNTGRAINYAQVTVKGGSWITVVKDETYRGVYTVRSKNPDTPYLYEFSVTHAQAVTFYSSVSSTGKEIPHQEYPVRSRWEYLGDAEVTSDDNGDALLTFKMIFDKKESVLPGGEI